MAANEIEKFLRNLSYVPYSNKPEVCVIESNDGSYFPGLRIENISFPLTINCVQAATVNCISEGKTPQKIHINSPNQVQKNWINTFDLEIHSLSDLRISPDTLYSSIFKLTDEEKIPAELEHLSKKARVKESNFPVASLLKVKDGYIGGVNVEFSDWQMGLCAERTALVKALAYGYTNFHELHLYAPKGTFISPCGACRQLLIEHMPDATLYVKHADGTQSNHFIKHLLPFNFHSKEL